MAHVPRMHLLAESGVKKRSAAKQKQKKSLANANDVPFWLCYYRCTDESELQYYVHLNQRSRGWMRASDLQGKLACMTPHDKQRVLDMRRAVDRLVTDW